MLIASDRRRDTLTPHERLAKADELDRAARAAPTLAAAQALADEANRLRRAGDRPRRPTLSIFRN